MPAVNASTALPAKLGDVLARVKAAFDAMGDPTPILVGEKYLEEGVGGADARVVFVAETKGKMGPPVELGDVASVTHGCEVYVRGAESGGDVSRFDAAVVLADRVIDCVDAEASGRVEWGVYEDGSPSDDDGHGAEIHFGFSYTRAVRHDPKRWALAAPTPDTSPAVPAIPPGTPGTVDTVTPTVVPQEG